MRSYDSREPIRPASTPIAERDRDRVIHTTAFRRLQYKTQVFIYNESENRLSHTIEVAQMGARWPARL